MFHLVVPISVARLPLSNMKVFTFYDVWSWHKICLHAAMRLARQSCTNFFFKRVPNNTNRLWLLWRPLAAPSMKLEPNVFSYAVCAKIRNCENGILWKVLSFWSLNSRTFPFLFLFLSGHSVWRKHRKAPIYLLFVDVCVVNICYTKLCKARQPEKWRNETCQIYF